jgi:ankyrin repeat protein
MLLLKLGNTALSGNYFDTDKKAQHFIDLMGACGVAMSDGSAVRTFFNEYSWLFDENGHAQMSGTFVVEFIERRDGCGNRPLLNAIRSGKDDLVIWLLKNGARPSPNALTAAIDQEVRGDTFRALLHIANKQGPGLVNAWDKDGYTPLTLAVRRGDLKYVDLLIKVCPGLDVDQRDIRGNTPLIFAASRGNCPMVDRLIKAGADVMLTNETGLSPLAFALQCWDDREDKQYGDTLESLVSALNSSILEGGDSAPTALGIIAAGLAEAHGSGQYRQLKRIVELAAF